MGILKKKKQLKLLTELDFFLPHVENAALHISLSHPEYCQFQKDAVTLTRVNLLGVFTKAGQNKSACHQIKTLPSDEASKGRKHSRI